MDRAQERVVELLHQRGAEQVPHPGGTLMAHLRRVEQRLHRDGADDVLRLAGLAHAVYGTDGFATHLLALAERPLLAEVASPEVETLVYLYAACDRKKTWHGLSSCGEIHDRWTGEIHRPDAEVLSQLADLSIVNELDVVERSPEIRASFGAELLELCRSWSGLTSSAVQADALQTLAIATMP